MRPAAWPLALLLVATAVRADQVSEFEISRQQQRQSCENLARSLPLVPARSIQDVLRLRLSNRNLVLDTPVKNSNGEFEQVHFDEVTGTKLIAVQRGAESGTLEAFHLNITDYATPKRITNLVVALTSSGLNISQSTQYAHGAYHSVTLLDQRQPDPASGGVTRLVINDAHSTGTAPTQRTYDSADFFTFLHEHPRESDEFVRPLMHELGQDALFGPDPLVVWQVFADLWKPEGLAMRQVMHLLPRLDDANYKVRDKALAELEQLGRDGAAVMTHLDRISLTPEQNARIDRALVPYAQLPPKEAARLRSDASFLLDCLYCEDAGLRQVALARLRQISRGPIQFDVNADAAARGSAIPRLRQQLLGTPSEKIVN